MTTADAGRAPRSAGKRNEEVPEVVQRGDADFESRRSEAEHDPERRRAAAGRDDHGPRRPRQDQAARRDPLDQRGGRRGRRHHPAHRRLPGRDPGPEDHLPRHAGPRGVHGHARPRRAGDGHRRAGRRRRRRRDAEDARGGRTTSSRPTCRSSWRSTRSTCRPPIRTGSSSSSPRSRSMPEEWGGDVPFVEVSAREKLGLDDLLEVILLVADVHDLKANPHKPAQRRGDRGQARPHPRPGRDGAGAERHAQPARRRRRRLDLGPRSRRCSTIAAAVCARPNRARRSRSSACSTCRRRATPFQVFDDEERRATWPSAARAAPSRVADGRPRRSS